MKKLLLLAIGMGSLAAGTAHAEWRLVEAGAAVRHYFDPETLQKTGDFPSVVVLHDFSEPTRGGELSARYRAEFDCKAKRWRLFDFATFSGAMASGDIVTHTDADPAGRSAWRELQTAPGFAQIFAFACAE